MADSPGEASPGEEGVSGAAHGTTGVRIVHTPMQKDKTTVTTPLNHLPSGNKLSVLQSDCNEFNVKYSECLTSQLENCDEFEYEHSDKCISVKGRLKDSINFWYQIGANKYISCHTRGSHAAAYQSSEGEAEQGQNSV